MRRRWLFMVPLAIAGFVVFAALGGFVVQFLWNWLLPTLFGLPLIGFGQALGLLALCRILFGGFGGRGYGRSRMRHRMWERWDAMTPEERARFREGMRGRCGGGPASA